MPRSKLDYTWSYYPSPDGHGKPPNRTVHSA
jgi:hypothetical protein